MAKVTYEKDEIVIDNEELLCERSDVDVLVDTHTGSAPEVVIREKSMDKGLGGIMEKGGEEEKTLKEHKKRIGWHEPSRKLEVEHVCPVCDTHFKGRRNKVYCSPKCKETGAKRKQRAKKREKRDFKPYMGTAGEVYFMATYEGKEVITFVPAFYATDRASAREYIKTNYPEKFHTDYIEQVNKVVKQ